MMRWHIVIEKGTDWEASKNANSMHENMHTRLTMSIGFEVQLNYNE